MRRVIGYVPQLVSADGALTGYENLLIFAKLYDIPRAERGDRIGEALTFMGLGEVRDKLVREYSGGMIRRLEIAESMLHRPPVLFLDEPTVGLDPAAREAVGAGRGSPDPVRDDDRVHHPSHGGGRSPVHAARDPAARARGGERHAQDLKAAVGPGTSMDDVFIRYASAEAGGMFRETSRRRTAQRLE